MDGQTLIIDGLGMLAQGLSAPDRWRALRNTGGTGMETDLMKWVLIVLGGILAVGTLAALFYIREQNRRRWRKFLTIGGDSGLREKEMALLERVARLSRLKDPSAMYSDYAIFNAAALGVMSSKRVAAFSEKAQMDLQAMLISIYAKLRFDKVAEGQSLGGIMSSQQIKAGSKIHVGRTGERETVEATIASSSSIEFLIESEDRLPGRREGDPLTIRYAERGGMGWEFDVKVIRCDGSLVAVEHSRKLRAVNFRRFPRVAASMLATGTALPFHVGSHEAPLEFMAIDIVEIAGPGLLLKLPAEAEVGQNLLIRLQLNDERSVQGMTKVRRIVTDKPGGPFTAVEFVELGPDELAELARATNLAAKRLNEQQAGTTSKRELAKV